MSEDTTDRAIVALSDALTAIKERPHRQQILAGVGAGLVAGYIFTKIGRLASLALGGSLIALQFVSKDCVKVDWRRLSELRPTSPALGPPLVNQFWTSVEENRIFFGSFGGGFLLAVSMS